MTETNPKVDGCAGQPAKAQSLGVWPRKGVNMGESNPAGFKGVKYKVLVDGHRIDKLPTGCIRTLVPLRPHQLQNVAVELSKKWGLASAAGISIVRDYSI